MSRLSSLAHAEKTSEAAQLKLIEDMVKDGASMEQDIDLEMQKQWLVEQAHKAVLAKAVAESNTQSILQKKCRQNVSRLRLINRRDSERDRLAKAFNKVYKDKALGYC